MTDHANKHDLVYALIVGSLARYECASAPGCMIAWISAEQWNAVETGDEVAVHVQAVFLYLSGTRTRPKSEPKSATFLWLQKQPDAGSEGVLLPLAFAHHATKVFCPPWYWNRGPGWLSSQGVLQSEETKIWAQISNFSRVLLEFRLLARLTRNSPVSLIAARLAWLR